jgi:hypothetical protein
MTAQEAARFDTLRTRLYDAIGHALEQDGHCKSYEGEWEVTLCFPNYWNKNDQPSVSLKLHCYVVGPSRHYEWDGKTFTEALDAAEVDVMSWIEEQAL